MRFLTTKKRLISLLKRICFLIALAFFISIFSTVYLRWQDNKILAWTKEINIDLSQTNVYTIPLSPVVSRTHLFRIDMQGPPLKEYNVKYDYISSKIIKEYIPDEGFELAWKLESSGNILSQGSVSISNFSGYIYKDKTDYSYIKEIQNLKHNKDYIFTINVVKSNHVLQEFKPILQIYTWIPKGHGFYDFGFPLTLSIIFLVGLIVEDYIKMRRIKSLIKAQSISSSHNVEVNKISN